MKVKRLTTTATQLQVLLKWMESHPTIVKPIHEPTERTKLIERWQKLSEILNENGPPTKSMLAWKKTWADCTHRAKSKFSKNKRPLKKTDQERRGRKQELKPFEKKINKLIGLVPNTNRIDEPYNTVMTSSLPSTSTIQVTETLIGNDEVTQFHEGSNVHNAVDLGANNVGQYELPQIKVEKCSSPNPNLSVASNEIPSQTKNEDTNETFLVGLLPYTKLFDQAETTMIPSTSTSTVGETHIVNDFIIQINDGTSSDFNKTGELEHGNIGQWRPSQSNENECVSIKNSSEKTFQTINETKDKQIRYRKKVKPIFRFHQQVINLLSDIRDINKEKLELKRKRAKDYLDIEQKKIDLWEQELMIASAANELKDMELKMKVKY